MWMPIGSPHTRVIGERLWRIVTFFHILCNGPKPGGAPLLALDREGKAIGSPFPQITTRSVGGPRCRGCPYRILEGEKALKTSMPGEGSNWKGL
jgi:hypothetical protein